MIVGQLVWTASHFLRSASGAWKWSRNGMAESPQSPCESPPRPPPISGYACDGVISSARRWGRDRSSALLPQPHRPLDQAAIPGDLVFRGRLVQPSEDDVSADLQEPALLDRSIKAVGLELLD